MNWLPLINWLLLVVLNLVDAKGAETAHENVSLQLAGQGVE